MIVYHGSYLEIDKPDLRHSRHNVDFGVGFYTTPIYDQAVKWCGKFKRRGRDAVVSRYEFDETAYTSLKVLKCYEKPNMQICFRTENAVENYLRFERSEKI